MGRAERLMEQHQAVLEAIQRAYRIVKPVEKASKYELFFGRKPVTEEELASKPHVLVVGQYSTGKTSLINNLIGQEYEGSHVDPEPTTDCFTAVCWGATSNVLKGNAASIAAGLPYQGLESFGQGFLGKFRACLTNTPDSSVLKRVSLIDTPGVLSGDKQRIGRSYDFAAVTRWFAERADLVLLLFDEHKLDISDEFKSVIEGLKGLDSKLRCVLNKADNLDSARLVRVYGALMFNVGKVLQSPEVVRVYCTSFGNEAAAIEGTDQEAMFVQDTQRLLKEIDQLPQNTTALKLDELVRRARTVKSHAKVLALLRERVGWLGLVTARRGRLLQVLDQVLAEERRPSGALEYGLGESYRAVLMDQLEASSSWWCWQLPQPDESELLRLEKLMTRVLPDLQTMLDGEEPQNDPQRVLTAIERDPVGRQWPGTWVLQVVGVVAVGSAAVCLYKKGNSLPRLATV